MNSLKAEIKKHLISTFFFTLFFVVIILVAHNSGRKNPYSDIDTLLRKSGLSLENELDRAILYDVISNYYDKEKARKFLDKIEKYRYEKVNLNSSNGKRNTLKLDFPVILLLLGKWIKFIFLFSLSAFLLFYLSESFALLKLKKEMQNENRLIRLLLSEIQSVTQNKYPKNKNQLKKISKIFFFLLIKIAAYLVLFSPVYVVAYMLKFNFENISTLAFILLTIFTNGMLILSVNKFYLLLRKELNQGYVETDKIKGLKTGFSKEDGISLMRIFSFGKDFGMHILKSVYLNAHRRFISDFREISRFLITGIIIVELSLNIQNGFFYEMLQSLMRYEFDILLFIVLLVFFAVKANDIIITYFFYKENRKYEND